MTKKKPTVIACPDCGGRGILSFATEDGICKACDGTGKVTKGGAAK